YSVRTTLYWQGKIGSAWRLAAFQSMRMRDTSGKLVWNDGRSLYYTGTQSHSRTNVITQVEPGYVLYASGYMYPPYPSTSPAATIDYVNFDIREISPESAVIPEEYVFGGEKTRKTTNGFVS